MEWFFVSLRRFLSLFSVLFLAGCLTVGGGNSGAVSGSAGMAGNEGSKELARCISPIGTTSVIMSDASVVKEVLDRLNLPPDPKPAIRLVLQQSNCFIVVNRDVALASMKLERKLRAEGELVEGSGPQKGQMIAADYTIIPEILFSEDNAGGLGAGIATIGGLFGPVGSLAGIVAGGLSFSEAQVLLTLVDNATSVQIATASGTASATNFGAAGALLGSTSLIAGGYERTTQGKVVIAAIVDAMNQLETSIAGTPRKNSVGKTATTSEQTASTKISKSVKHELVRDIQNALNERGNDVVVDGLYGSQTKTAIIAYQKEQGLLMDGRATKELLAHLQKTKQK